MWQKTVNFQKKISGMFRLKLSLEFRDLSEFVLGVFGSLTGKNSR